MSLFARLSLNYTATVSILVASPYTFDTPDFLVTCQRHPRNICYEDATRKLLPWLYSAYDACRAYATCMTSVHLFVSNVGGLSVM